MMQPRNVVWQWGSEKSRNKYENAMPLATIADLKVIRRKNVLDWLSPYCVSERHEAIREKRIEHTGQWFLNANQFQNWIKAEDPALLLCLGKGSIPLHQKLSHILSWSR
jgi:hypothetical protein